MKQTTRSNRPLVSIFIYLGSVCAIFVTFAVAKKIGALDPIDAKRCTAATLGFVLVIAGNFMPKIGLFYNGDENYAQAKAAERFAGIVFVSAGLGFVSLWIFTPLEVAMFASPILGIAAFGATAIHWMSQKRSSRLTLELKGIAGVNQESTLAGRIVILQILFAILSVFVIFLADAIWGDSVSQSLAMVLALAISMSALPVAHSWARSESRPE